LNLNGSIRSWQYTTAHRLQWWVVVRGCYRSVQLQCERYYPVRTDATPTVWSRCHVFPSTDSNDERALPSATETYLIYSSSWRTVCSLRMLSACQTPRKLCRNWLIQVWEGTIPSTRFSGSGMQWNQPHNHFFFNNAIKQGVLKKCLLSSASDSVPCKVMHAREEPSMRPTMRSVVVALMALSSKESNGVLSRENPYLFSIRIFTWVAILVVHVYCVSWWINNHFC
jgi:hypothetical protein